MCNLDICRIACYNPVVLINVSFMTKDIPHILTEETERKLFQETILPYLLRGESVTAMWVRHAGKRRTCRFLAQFSEHFDYQALGRYKIISVPHGDLVEDTPRGFFQLMLSCLNQELENQSNEDPFCLFKSRIAKSVEEGFNLIFIFERFDELVGNTNYPQSFFDNLHTLWQVDKTKIHFVFSASTNIFKAEGFSKLNHFKEVVSQNIVYFPLLEARDNDICIQTLIKKYGYKVTSKQISLIKKITGGHASLNRAALRILQNYYSVHQEKIIDYLLDQYEVKIILEDIWNSFDGEEKKILTLIAQGNTFKQGKIPERFTQLKIVTSMGRNSYQLFSPIFQSFIANLKGSSSEVSLDLKTGEVLVNGLPAKEKISLQEYHLLNAFIKKKDCVLSRDQIAQVLWGKDFEEKYSDWAIDQVISQLRNKLDKLDVSSSKLQTIRNRGYRWVE